MCGIWFSKKVFFFVRGYFGTDERLAIKRGDRSRPDWPTSRGLTQWEISRPSWNVMFWFPRGSSRVRLFEMFASFVTRNLKTFVQREQAQNVVKLSKISVKIGYFTTLHHSLLAGSTGFDKPRFWHCRGVRTLCSNTKIFVGFQKRSCWNCS